MSTLQFVYKVVY